VFRSFRVPSLVHGTWGHAGDEWFVDASIRVIHEGAGPVKSSADWCFIRFFGSFPRSWAGVCAAPGSRRSARRRSRGRTALRPAPCAPCWSSRDEGVSEDRGVGGRAGTRTRSR